MFMSCCYSLVFIINIQSMFIAVTSAETPSTIPTTYFDVNVNIGNNNNNNNVNTNTNTTAQNASTTITIETSQNSTTYPTSSANTTTTTKTINILPSTANVRQPDPAADIKCLSINTTSSDALTINTTSTNAGTVVQATCASSHRLFSTKDPNLRTAAFLCDGGLWSPYTPRCLPVSTDGSNTTAIIIGSLFGAVIGVAIIVGALILFRKMRKDRKLMYEKQEEYDNKLSRINEFVMSTFDDSVGMPPVTVETRWSDMRGVPMDFMQDKFDVASSTSSSLPEVEEKTLHLY